VPEGRAGVRPGNFSPNSITENELRPECSAGPPARAPRHLSTSVDSDLAALLVAGRCCDLRLGVGYLTGSVRGDVLDSLLGRNPKTVTEEAQVIAVIVPNIQGLARDWTKYRVSVNDMEDLTGYTFFSRLRPAVAEKLKARKGDVAAIVQVDFATATLKKVDAGKGTVTVKFAGDKKDAVLSAKGATFWRPRGGKVKEGLQDERFGLAKEVLVVRDMKDATKARAIILPVVHKPKK
jgi:hypothetical protein